VWGAEGEVGPMWGVAGMGGGVTRRTIDGKNPKGWYPEQRITAEEALRAYTSEAAWAAFEEREKGTLSPGKLADFVVLSADPLTIAPDSIEKIEVLRTVAGGRVVYGKD